MEHCKSEKSCIFPPSRDGICRYHLQDLEYEFSLPDVSNLFHIYEYTELIVTDGGYGGKGVVFGFSIDDKHHKVLWTNRVRFGGQRRPRNWGRWLDSQAAKRKRPERMSAHKVRVRLSEEERKRRDENRKLRVLQVQEQQEKAAKERRIDVHANSKWGAHVDACCALGIDKDILFKNTGEQNFRQRFRAMLSMNTSYRFSVKTEGDSVRVKKIGTWESFSTYGAR